MSAKAYNRGSQVISRQITKAEEARAGRMFDKLVHEGEKLEAKYDQQTIELDACKAELEKAKEAYQRRTAELAVLRDELIEANRSKDWWHEQSMGFLRAYQSIEKKHQKLSAIVRLALPPERYHEYRKVIEADYPEFAE